MPFDLRGGFLNEYIILPTMEIDIRKIDESEINGLWHIVQSCAERLTQKGITHWNEQYNKDILLEKIRDNDVYMIFKEGDPVGTIILSTNTPPYYMESDSAYWNDSSVSALFVSTLATLPTKVEGRSLGERLMGHAESEAKERGISYIRLTTVSHNEQLEPFYSKLGYTLVQSRLNNSMTINFFEKQINQ